MSEECLVHRVSGYPAVGAAREAMGTALVAAKAQPYGVGAMAGWAEWAAGKGLGLGQQLAETAPAQSLSKALAARLPAVEAALPALTMSGGEFKAAYYQGSRLAGLVGVAGDWAASGKEKAAAVGDAGANKTGQLLHASVDVLHGLLDRTEHFVDRYAAPAAGHSKTTGEHDYAKSEGGLTARFSAIMAKTTSALKGRLPELPAVNLGELGKAKDGAVESIAALGGTIKQRAASAGSAVVLVPENTMVAVVKLAVSLSAALAAKSLPLTPRPLYAPGEKTAAYLAGLEGRLAGQARAGDVARTAWAEAKAAKAALDAGLLAALDALADSAPFAWITAKTGPTRRGCSVAKKSTETPAPAQADADEN